MIVAAHDERLAEHGGGSGIRDEGPLDSALARPRNLAHYREPEAGDVAASYAFGLARDHPFVDGNERTAFVALELFLDLNGHLLDADDADCVLTMLAMASGAISEQDFAAWVRRHCKPR